MISGLFLSLGLLAFSLVAGVWDVIYRRIPNWLILSGLLSALVLRVASEADFAAIPSLLLGCGMGLLALMPFYVARGIAAGDVKMMMVVGAFVGPVTVLKIALATSVIGGIGAVLIVVCNGNARAVLANMHCILVNHLLRAGLPLGAASSEKIAFPSVGRMPYGPAIALATAIVVLGQ